MPIKKCEAIRKDQTLNAETKVYLIAKELNEIHNINIDLYYSILELKDKYIKNIQQFEYDHDIKYENGVGTRLKEEFDIRKKKETKNNE